MRMKLLIGLSTMVIVALLLAGCFGSRQPGQSSVAGGSPTSETQADASQADTQPEPQKADEGPKSEATTDKAQEEKPSLPDYNIVTLLPRDAIPAIFDPQFLNAEQADTEYEPSEFVLGVEIDGDARAYSIPFLSGHEIVNDTVGGVPIAVTW